MDYPEQQNPSPESIGQPQAALPAAVDLSGDPAAISSQELTPEQKKILIGVVIAFLIMLCASLVGVAWLYNQPPRTVALIRDIFIIFMAATSLLLAFVLVILIIQLARLTNLLQNEVGPILDATNETLANLRGTTTFLSENLTEPVIRLNETIAGVNSFWRAIGLSKKPSKSKPPNNPPTKGV